MSKSIRRFVEAQIVRELNERINTDASDARKMNYSKVKDETKPETKLQKHKETNIPLPPKSSKAAPKAVKQPKIKLSGLLPVTVNRTDKDEVPTLNGDDFQKSTEPKKIDEACWKGYKQLGMKKKGKRQVPNCVKEGADLKKAH